MEYDAINFQDKLSLFQEQRQAKASCASTFATAP